MNPRMLFIPALLMAAGVLAAGDAPQTQQITMPPPPRVETSIRSVALDKDGQPTPEGQQVLAQMGQDGWRPGSMTALSPVQVAVLFTRSIPPPKPPAPPAAATPPATAPAASQQTEGATVQSLLASAASSRLQTTASGLRWLAVRPGTGRTPGPTDRVTVRYTGAKLDGTVFDASARHGGAGTAQFGLNQVIKGWTEGLQLMQEGSVYHFVIPANLAYGKNGPPSIGADQTLLFEVELISIP